MREGKRKIYGEASGNCAGLEIAILAGFIALPGIEPGWVGLGGLAVFSPIPVWSRCELGIGKVFSPV